MLNKSYGEQLDITLGVLPKIPFKLTQSIHVALQKNAILKILRIMYSLTLNQ